MPKKYLITGLFFIFSSFGFAQRSELKGKIMGSADLEGIYIINLNSNHATTSENNGYFRIAVQVNDTLQFSAVHIKGRKVVLKASDIAADLFFVNVELASYNLNEVVINKSNINAVSMGILSAPAKKYTPAERKLYTATDGGKATFGLSNVISFDRILNSISGRTTMLKKEVAVERKEYTIRKLNEWFEEDFYIERLKIPADYIKGFQYFLAENAEFESVVKSKNKTKAIFIMGEMAGNYLKIINEK